MADQGRGGIGVLDSPLKPSAVETIDLTSSQSSNDPVQLPDTPTRPSVDSVNDADSDEFDDDDAFSIYEDDLEEFHEELCEGDFPSNHHRLRCTPEESLFYRKRLRQLGGERFFEEVVKTNEITAKKLCTAFDVQPPWFLEGGPDSAYHHVLRVIFSRELSKRIKLARYNTVEDAISLLEKSRNIMVITGAGISTSLGVPDFRSKDTGLYARLGHLGLSDPQEVFDIDIFRQDPTIFYSIARDILPSTTKFTPTHAFIRLLHDKGKLLTNYTQNIDNIESHAGIPSERLIQCHGSFATASCQECHYQVLGNEIYKDIKAGRIPRCDRCVNAIRQTGLKRKRAYNALSSNKRKRRDYEHSTDDEDYDVALAGVMKPDITFFGEALPKAFHTRLTAHDQPLVDLVIVIGTSLKVAPVSDIIGFLPSHVPQLYISREPCSVAFDIDMLGDCDIVVAELCRRVGWHLEHEMIPQTQKVQINPSPTSPSAWHFEVPKE